MPLVFPDVNVKPPVQEALSILQRHTAEYGLYLDLDRIYEYVAMKKSEFNSIDRKLSTILKAEVPYSRPAAMLDLFRNYLQIPESKLFNNKKNAYTADKDIRLQLIDDPELSEEIRLIVKKIHEAKGMLHAISYFDQYKELPICTSESFDNHRMVLAQPIWGLLHTGRIGASKPSIQNLYREFGDLITYPKGYLLVRADSGQIEPRIMYSAFVPDPLIKNLITLYDDAYRGLAVFCTMTPEEERMYREDFSKYVKLPEDDAFLERRNKMKTLCNAGNYGSANLDYIDPVLAEAFTRKITNHPLRKQLEERVTTYVNRGGESFTTAFGSVITPEENQKYKRGQKGWKNHVIRCGINNPVQGTAADLMNFSVVRADELLSSVKNAWIGYYKHDEGAFYIPDTREDLIPELTELTAYTVADWIPIKSDALIGVKQSEVPRLVV